MREPCKLASPRPSRPPGQFRKWYVALRWPAVAALAVLTAGWWNGCATRLEHAAIRPPRIEGAEFVGNQACADCHTNIVQSFPNSGHGRFYKPSPANAGLTGCESCHGPGSRHIQSSGDRARWIANPGNDPGICVECHLGVGASFRLPHRHPVMEGRIGCVDCHDPHGSMIFQPASAFGMASENQLCGQCHREQTRPFIYEHEALREGCTTCHDPHGSINDQFLRERDSNLCLRCHAQMAGPDLEPGRAFVGKVDHSLFFQAGTCWSAGCHTAVHGSNVNPKMLY